MPDVYDFKQIADIQLCFTSRRACLCWTVFSGFIPLLFQMFWTFWWLSPYRSVFEVVLSGPRNELFLFCERLIYM